MRIRQRGISLIELLVVIAILGILTAIAIPTYRQYIVRAKRTHAKTTLTQVAQWLERCYTTSTPMAYNSAVCNAAVTFPITTAEGGDYVITATTLTAQTYTLTATPQAGQALDTKCANFTLTHQGVRGVSGTESATPNQCWQR